MEKHGPRFEGAASRLRAEDRLARLEPERVVALATEGLIAPQILDIGTGTGVFAEAFQKTGLSVTGLDANPAFLEEARRLVPQATFLEATAEALPFEDQSFALAFLSHLLHEADDPLQVLREAKRVAQKRIVILEWPYEQELFGPPLAHRLAPEAIQKLAKKAGLKDPVPSRLKHTVLYRIDTPPT